ncbi:MAG: class I poly(R)-hydroxyalkanoic acid synthase, partial [Pseudomonadales bacterium]
MLTNIVDNIEFDDEKEAARARFYTRQYINSAAPTNMALANPEVCREILETKGENLVHGIQNFVKDLQQSPIEALKITQSDPDAFRLGENLATTPGKVVFQNELLQLIQYQASTEKVYKIPLLITPPFINKYYIMDLDEKKSLVRWLVDQGHTVFMVSWVNPDASLADTEFEDYVVDGLCKAIDVVREISGQEKIHAVGYCVGGT